MSFILITGASGGIGRVTSELLVKQGNNVILTDVQSPNDLAKELKTDNREILSYDLDVSNEESVTSVFEDLNNQSLKVKGLVHLAGIIRDKTLLKMSIAEWDSVIDVNLRGTFLMTKNSAELMTDTGGSIILTASTAALFGNYGQANYVASKSGVIGFTKTVARELARYNIRVNALVPGFITSPMTDTIPKQVYEGIIKQIPLQRPGTPLDIANVIEFLLSDKSSYITGTTINIDGGLRM
ncbi:MAG: SDR family oxidoreductase [Candidatus Heimdallarchaeota archaeon]|nr:SDR family oxidoreductase [Candidatus Heimdallarchaeota archaeon]